MGFNLDDYEPVEDRLKKFWQDHPEGRIMTSVEYASESQSIITACVYRPGNTLPWATGTARAVYGLTGKSAQATSPVEDAETSAIGRALANAGYSTSKRASREEMAIAEDNGMRAYYDLSHLVRNLADNVPPEVLAYAKEEFANKFPGVKLTSVPEEVKHDVEDFFTALPMKLPTTEEAVEALAERFSTEEY